MKRIVVAGYARSPFTLARKGELATVRPDDLARSTVKEPMAEQAITSFEDNLRREAANITVRGEQDAVSAMQARWNAFRVVFQEIRESSLTESDRRTRYGSIVAPAGLAVKDAAQRIIDLNLQSILSTDGVIRHDAERARHLMIALLCGGVGLAAVCITLFARSLLEPLSTLTRSAREIERGNLDEKHEDAEWERAVANRVELARIDAEHRTWMREHGIDMVERLVSRRRSPRAAQQ